MHIARLSRAKLALIFMAWCTGSSVNAQDFVQDLRNGTGSDVQRQTGINLAAFRNELDNRITAQLLAGQLTSRQAADLREFLNQNSVHQYQLGPSGLSFQDSSNLFAPLVEVENQLQAFADRLPRPPLMGPGVMNTGMTGLGYTGTGAVGSPYMGSGTTFSGTGFIGTGNTGAGLTTSAFEAGIGVPGSTSRAGTGSATGFSGTNAGPVFTGTRNGNGGLSLNRRELVRAVSTGARVGERRNRAGKVGSDKYQRFQVDRTNSWF